MRAFVCPLVCSLFACSNAATVVAGSDSGHLDGGGVEAAIPEAGPSLYLPAGYTLVPELSGAPVRTFTQADQVLDANKDYLAVIETDVGRVVVDLLEKDTPVTCNSFVFLARHHFFDGIAFHRVIDKFMAQTGDPNSVSKAPSSWGQGGPGYTFALEVKPSLNFDAAGVVGMARASDPNSNGSQFFITFEPATNLNQQYTVFGKVSEGLDVLPQIVRGEPPSTPTRIRSLYIGEK